MQSDYLLFNFMKVSYMLLQYLYFLFVKLSITIFCEMSCVLLDSNVYVVEENQYMYNFLYFIMHNVNFSFEEIYCKLSKCRKTK